MAESGRGAVALLRERDDLGLEQIRLLRQQRPSRCLPPPIAGSPTPMRPMFIPYTALTSTDGP